MAILWEYTTFSADPNEFVVEGAKTLKHMVMGQNPGIRMVP
jgi:hypothetical protein